MITLERLSVEELHELYKMKQHQASALISECKMINLEIEKRVRWRERENATNEF